ncbi:MAG: hypothetical protein IJ899_18110 [Blautia sp.]|nr:hypothetical protein [Blautia sp.]
MKSENHANALLVELLIVIFFFMLGATILVQVFERSYHQGQKAQIGIYALSEAQNAADRLYQADDVEAELESMGFAKAGDEESWRLEKEGYVLEITCETIQKEAGILRQARVRALMGEEELLCLPCTRYLSGE